MSSFGAKRKVRKIAVQDESDEEGRTLSQASAAETTGPPRFTKRPVKSSLLRRSLNVPDGPANIDENSSSASGRVEEDEDDGPVVVKPTISRSGSQRSKKKKDRPRDASGGRLSFGPSPRDDRADDEGDDLPVPKPKSTLGRKALFNSARNLPMRSIFPSAEEEVLYDEKYLAELQSSTPTTAARTPGRNNGTKPAPNEAEDDEMILDPSEIEDATIVPGPSDPIPPTALSASTSLLTTHRPTDPDGATRILTHAEIAERKARRHKLALAASAQEEQDGEEENYISLSVTTTKKPPPRQVPATEDPNDLESGPYSSSSDPTAPAGTKIQLTKKSRREARRRHRAEIATQIAAAEHEDESEDDSEAERVAMFENAQTRAAMEGWAGGGGGGGGGPSASRPSGYRDHHQQQAVPMPAKITPLPDVNDVLARIRGTLRGMEEEMAFRERRLEERRRERAELEARGAELQVKLAEAGEVYRKMLGGIGAGVVDGGRGSTPGDGTPGRLGLGAVGTPVFAEHERGLESFGNTPVRVPGGSGDGESGSDDEDMGGM